MKVLSFGAGMQSTALALMSCENAGNAFTPYPAVPVYDAVIFCDLGLEPSWVVRQVEFTRLACEKAAMRCTWDSVWKKGAAAKTILTNCSPTNSRW